MNELFFSYFGFPHGAVWSNVAAEPIIVALTAACIFPLRHKIGKHLVAWWHKHHTAHLESLRQKDADGA